MVDFFSRTSFYNKPWFRYGVWGAVALITLGTLWWSYLLTQAPVVDTEPMESEVAETEQDQTPDPTGYVYFTDYDNETERTRPAVYSVENGERTILEEYDDEGLFYMQVLPIPSPEGTEFVFFNAQFNPDANPLPFDGLPRMDIDPFEPAPIGVISPRRLRESLTMSWNAFHGLAPHVTLETAADLGVTVSNEFSNVSTYFTSPDEFRELPEVVSPTWDQDETGVYVLGQEGIYHYELESGLLERVVTLPDRLPIPANTITYDAENYKLYVNSSADELPDDMILSFTVDPNDPRDVTFYDQRSLPETDGHYSDITISPGGTHLGILHREVNDESGVEVTEFRILSTDLGSSDSLDTLFSVEHPIEQYLTQPYWSEHPLTPRIE